MEEEREKGEEFNDRVGGEVVEDTWRVVIGSDGVSPAASSLLLSLLHLFLPLFRWLGNHNGLDLPVVEAEDGPIPPSR